MNIIITGGHGDIAKEVCAIFKDHTVFAPGRDTLDVTNEVQIDQYFSQQDCDVLINNAGYICPQPIAMSLPTIWKKEIEINLLGTYFCCRGALQNNQNVKIINIGSSAAYQGKADWSAYCASKAGVMSLTESLIAEGVDAYCLNIGRTATKMRYALYGQENPATLLTPLEVAVELLDIVDGKRTERIYRLQK